ncbi:MAG: glutamate--tRNA ligase [Bacillota bacterium]|nr:MAG: glutamate--tRNA ligase [Bacillota bacterium]
MAPSPTGPVHVGNLHTALFNWLFARGRGGKFVLRFEDTDRERSEAGFERLIFEEMRWLGLDWDEGPDVGGPYGPYRQSERLPLYREYAERLLGSGHVYPCYCTQEELDAERREAQKAGRAYKYGGRCRRLDRAGRAAMESEGRAPALRFAVPEGQVIGIDDLIRGRIDYPTDSISDFIIVRPNGMPLYNFAVVVDDITMDITHVIRGEGHISNTPVQCLLYDALDAERPAFGHVGHILLPSREKMAKRAGNAYVGMYREQGFLPEAVVNFMALLGWTPPDGREFLSLREIVREFSIDRVTKAPSVFDHDKLTWMNANYIRRLSERELAERCLPFLKDAGLVSRDLTPDGGREEDRPPAPPGMVRSDFARVTWIVSLEQERVQTLAEIVPATEFFFRREIDYEKNAVTALRAPGVRDALAKALAEFEACPEWLPETLEAAGRRVVSDLGLSPKEVFQPVRAAITGRLASPPLFDTMAALGRELCLARLARAVSNNSSEVS